MCQKERLGPCQIHSVRKRKTREWLNREKVIQKEDKRGICGHGDEESRCVKEEYFEDDGNTDKYCWPWRRDIQTRVRRRKKQGLAEEDNEVVRVEKTGLHCTARMRKNRDTDASSTHVLLLAVLIEMGGLGEKKDANDSPS